MTPNSSRSGFTLLELMVALTAGAIAISSIYFVGNASTRHFHEQSRVSVAQSSVRLASELLRSDIARAGYLGVGNSRRSQRCWTPPGGFEVQAINFIDGQMNNRLPNNAANGSEADTLILNGSYATPEQFLIIGVSAGGNQIFLQQNWQAFRRAFMPTGAAIDTAAFTNVFVVGRAVKLTTTAGNIFMNRVAGVNALAASVTLASPIPIGGTCTGGLADGATISVLSSIRWGARSLAADGAFSANLPTVSTETAATETAKGSLRTYLVRNEIAPTGGALAAQFTAPVIISDMLAMLDIDFIVDQQPDPDLPAALVRLDDAAASLALDDVNVQVAATPERVRAVIAEVAIRSNRQDPSFPFVPRAVAPNSPLISYKVSPTAEGSARVRSLRQEILTPNIR